MRLPIPSRLVARWIRRLAGAGREVPLRAVRIYPRAIEIALERRPGVLEEVQIAPVGGRRWLLLALAPLLFVTLGPAARLHLRIGGLPYALDALLTTARGRSAAQRLRPPRRPAPFLRETAGARPAGGGRTFASP